MSSAVAEEGIRQPRLSRLRAGDYALDSDALARILSPALVVYQDKVERNVARVLEYMGGDPLRWRPHLKTTKIPEVYALLVDAGLRSFKCATVREAECMLRVLAERGVEDADLLIAYPLQGPALQRAAQLASLYPDTALSVLSEDPVHATGIAPALGVYVDVNPGMNRTGIPMTQAQRIQAVVRAAGQQHRGVHFYDGHIHQESAAARRRAAHDIYAGLLILLQALEDDGLPVGDVITSGTPSFRYALDFPAFGDGRVPVGGGRHQVSPGTVVFHDFQYDEQLEDLDLEPAAVVLARVISHPCDGIVTCDAGSKSIAAECGNPVGFAVGRPDLVALSPSEEHLPLSVQGGDEARPALGECLYLVPRHVCPTVNLAEQALLVRSNGALEVVTVAGRAHPLMLEE